MRDETVEERIAIKMFDGKMTEQLAIDQIKAESLAESSREFAVGAVERIKLAGRDARMRKASKRHDGKLMASGG